MKFVWSSKIDAPSRDVFAFHERPDAFQLLVPPWQKMRVIQPPTSLEIGTIVIVEVRFAPLVWRRIVVEHVEYEPGRMFADRQIEGPFRSWLHRHIVTPIDDRTCTLTDDIEAEIPRLIAPIARRQLARLFAYRHDATRDRVKLGA